MDPSRHASAAAWHGMLALFRCELLAKPRRRSNFAWNLQQAPSATGTRLCRALRLAAPRCRQHPIPLRS
jgi:hypothetical protein